MCCKPSAAFKTASQMSLRTQCCTSSAVIHLGSSMAISFTGNSNNTLEMISRISFSSNSRQLTGITGTPYFLLMFSHSATDFADAGSVQFIKTTNGLWISCSSVITRCSASSYSSRSISLMLPSVVMTSPIVECSLITFLVPISAAMLNGIGSSYHGVITMRG